MKKKAFLLIFSTVFNGYCMDDVEPFKLEAEKSALLLSLPDPFPALIRKNTVPDLTRLAGCSDSVADCIGQQEAVVRPKSIGMDFEYAGELPQAEDEEGATAVFSKRKRLEKPSSSKEQGGVSSILKKQKTKRRSKSFDIESEYSDEEDEVGGPKGYDALCMDGCGKSFHAGTKRALAVGLLNHKYTIKHNPKKHQEVRQYVTENMEAISARKWSIQCSDGCGVRMNSSKQHDLVRLLITHRFASTKHNSGEFKQAEGYVEQHANT